MKKTYYITCTTSDTYWHRTSCTSLRSAKMAASRMYQQSRDSKILVGVQYDDEECIETMAVKHGFEGWN